MKKPNDACDESEAEAILGSTLRGVNGRILPDFAVRVYVKYIISVREEMEWLLVVVPGVIWGASFLFIAEGLQAMAPMGVTFVRIAIGFVTLSLVPSARGPIVRHTRVGE